MFEPERLIALHGGYRKLKSFQMAQLIYDVTVRFCDRYVNIWVEAERRGPTRTGTDGQGPVKCGKASVRVGERPCPSVSSVQLAANAALSLLNLCCHLLDRQLAAQAAAFEKDGGFTERLYRVRTTRRT